MSSRSINLLVVLVLGASAAAVWWIVGSDGDATVPSRPDEVGGVAEAEEVSEDLQKPADSVFGERVQLDAFDPVESSLPEVLRPMLAVETLGPLGEQAKAHQRERRQAGVEMHKGGLQTFRETMDAVSEDDLLEEARLMRRLGRAVAMLSDLESDRYWTIELGTKLPRLDRAVSVSMLNRETDFGTTVDVIYTIVPSEHPNLASADDYLRRVERYWLETKIEKHNALDLDARRSRIEADKKAWAALSARGGGQLKPEEEAVVLPRGVLVEESTYRLLLDPAASK